MVLPTCQSPVCSSLTVRPTLPGSRVESHIDVIPRDAGSLCPTLGVMDDPPSLAEQQRSSFARASRLTRASWPEGDALTAAELESFLASRRYAVLATTKPDGRPHAVMVAFLWRDGRFWLPSVGGSIRLRNVAHRPEASLVVTAGEGEDHVAVIVEGRCRVHLDVATVLDGSFRARWRQRFETAAEWAEAVIELTPEKVLSHGRGRLPPAEP